MEGVLVLLHEADHLKVRSKDEIHEAGDNGVRDGRDDGGYAEGREDGQEDSPQHGGMFAEEAEAREPVRIKAGVDAEGLLRIYRQASHECLKHPCLGESHGRVR